MTYRADIDGLRGIAVLAVVAFHAHAALLPGGFAGVDVFFVISGFLITSLLLQALGAGTFSAADFYARRIRRLAPSLVVVLGAALAAGWIWLLTPDLSQLATHVASSAAFITNFVLWREAGYFDTAADQKPLLHLWSLGVEEQFYLLWPALLWLTWGRVRPIALIAALAILSFVANVLTIHPAPSAAFYWPTSRMWELAIGGILACLPPVPVTTRVRSLVAGGGLALLVASFVSLRGTSAFPGWWALLPASGTALLIWSGPDALVNRGLAVRVLVWVGLISYPLYLWHWPVLTFARMLAGGEIPPASTAAVVALSIALAWLSYRSLERPLRRTPSRVTVPGLAAAVIAVGAVGLTIHLGAASLPERFPREVQTVVNFSYRYEEPYRERTCYLMPDQPPSALAPQCIETAPAGTPLIVLWGDSHAAHLYPGLRQLQMARAFRLAEFTGSRCPPLLDVETPAQPYCQDVNRLALSHIASERPTTIVMAARWRLYEHSPFDRTIAELRRITPARIVVIGPVPTWVDRLPRVLFHFYRGHPRRPLPSRMSYGLAGYVWDFDREVREAVARAGAEYVSAMDVLCSADGCLTRVSEQPDSLTAWDETHLTTVGAEYLLARVADRILPAAP